MYPASMSSSEIPPLRAICTSPSVFLTLQVPQTPKVQPDGVLRPDARAVAGIASVSAHFALTPDMLNVTSALPSSAGITSSSAGWSAVVSIGAWKLS